MKLKGIRVPGLDVSKDGKKAFMKEKRLDVCTEIKRKRSPRKKYEAVKPSERDFRG